MRDKKFVLEFFLSMIAGFFLSSGYSIAIAATSSPFLSPLPSTSSHIALLKSPARISPILDSNNNPLTISPSENARLQINKKPTSDHTRIVLSASDSSGIRTPERAMKTTIEESLASDVPDVSPSPSHAPSPAVEAVMTAVSPTPSAGSSGSLNAEAIFSLVNAHRASIGLPAFEKEGRVCELAIARAPEISEEIRNGHMHSGMYGRNLPYWNTENIIEMGSETAAVTWWLSDYIHKKAIESSHTYSCVACHGNACAQEFTSFEPK